MSAASEIIEKLTTMGPGSFVGVVSVTVIVVGTAGGIIPAFVAYARNSKAKAEKQEFEERVRAESASLEAELKSKLAAEMAQIGFEVKKLEKRLKELSDQLEGRGGLGKAGEKSAGREFDYAYACDSLSPSI